MKILIAGIPGVGKSEISKALGKLKKFKVINDKDYSIKNNLGYFEVIDGYKEYFVGINALNKSVLKYLKSKDDIIFEGHLWCELSKNNLKYFDNIILLTADKKIIYKRLEKRGYRLVKIEENIFCQEQGYISEIFDSKKIKYTKIKIGNNLKNNLKKISEKIW
jgi:adenylate kinase